MTCEKCWADAYLKSKITGKSQAECYFDLLKERADNPCSQKEQAGQFWDERNKCDKRINKGQKMSDLKQNKEKFFGGKK